MGFKEKSKKKGGKKMSSSPAYPSGYIVGLCTLGVGTLGFIAGFASPYWHFSRRVVDGGTRVHGLWTTCDQESGSLSNCQDNVVITEDLLRVTQFLQSLAALLLLMACLVAVVINFTGSRSWRTALDVFMAFGAMFAVLGTLSYLFYVLSSPDDDTLEFQTFTWGFGINATGSVLCALATTLIATCRAPPDTSDGGMPQSPNSKTAAPKPSYKGKNSTKSKGNHHHHHHASTKHVVEKKSEA